MSFFFFFFFNDTATTEIYTLSLHDALPISQVRGFEKFTEGRPFYEMPGITARICGICPVDRKSTRLNSSHLGISYAVFCLKKKKKKYQKLPQHTNRVRAHGIQPTRQQTVFA